MSPAVHVASAETVNALEKRVAALAALVEQLQQANGTAEVYPPKEIARRFRLDHRIVYAACHSGALVADRRPARGGFAYYITLADARSWYLTTVRKTDQ